MGHLNAALDDEIAQAIQRKSTLLKEKLDEQTAGGGITLEDLANLEIIRVHRFRPWQTRTFSETPAGASTDLNDVRVPQDMLLIVTEIVAIDEDSAPALVSVGAEINGTFNPFNAVVSPSAGAATRFSGQMILKEGDRVVARFANATANDALRLIVNGYTIHE